MSQRRELMTEISLVLMLWTCRQCDKITFNPDYEDEEDFIQSGKTYLQK